MFSRAPAFSVRPHESGAGPCALIFKTGLALAPERTVRLSCTLAKRNQVRRWRPAKRASGKTKPPRRKRATGQQHNLKIAPKTGEGPAVIPPGPLTDQPACKPGSVRRSADALHVTAIPLGRRLPGASSNLPGRPDPDIDPETACAISRRPYSVLLPVGFAVPPTLPSTRCALTAPFHPYRG